MLLPDVYCFKLHMSTFQPCTIYIRVGAYNLLQGLHYVLSWSARGTHLRPMCFPKRAPHAMCASAQDAHIGIGQLIVHKQLAGFSDFNEGMILRDNQVR